MLIRSDGVNGLQNGKAIWTYLCNSANAVEMFILCVALFRRFPDLDLIVPLLLSVGAEAGLLLFMNNIHVSFVKLENQLSVENAALLPKTEFSLLNDLHLWHSMLMAISFVCLGMPWWIAISAAKLVCLRLFVRPSTK